MFGALAGKLLVEGRRPILLNQCVPANHRVSCQGGRGTAGPGRVLKISKKEFTFNIPNFISSQILQLLQMCFCYFECYVRFLKAILK